MKAIRTTLFAAAVAVTALLFALSGPVAAQRPARTDMARVLADIKSGSDDLHGVAVLPGGKIVFTSNRNGRPEIFTMNRDATCGGTRTGRAPVSRNQSARNTASIAATMGPVQRVTSSRLMTPGRKSLATMFWEPE